MKRTVIRYSDTINTGKWEQICQIAQLFRDEKNVHLQYYNQDKNDVEADKKDHTQRDELVAQKYEPKTELQARLWKSALKTAYETTDKFWCALAVELKPMIAKHKKDWSDAEIQYGYWLCYSGKRLAEWVETQAPVPTDFEVSPKEQKRVRNYLRRVIQRKRGSRPAAQPARGTHTARGPRRRCRPRRKRTQASCADTASGGQEWQQCL